MEGYRKKVVANNVKVIDKTTLLVHGLDVELADAKLLRSHEYFGQYGAIKMIRFFEQEDVNEKREP